MRSVQPKTVTQQDLQVLHRARALLMRELAALSNQIRGMLQEYGLVLRTGKAALRKMVPLFVTIASP